jgi:DNA-binding GntR family transcriptional regulator
MMEAKRAFFARICSGAKNPLAFEIISRLMLRTSGLRRRSLMRRKRQQQSVKEVDGLISAIRKRDAKAAHEAAMRNVASSARAAFET